MKLETRLRTKSLKSIILLLILIIPIITSPIVSNAEEAVEQQKDKTTQYDRDNLTEINIGNEVIPITAQDWEDPELYKLLEDQSTPATANTQPNTYQYRVPATNKAVLGCDVSKWQGTIDWNKARNEGIKYVFIRAGYRGQIQGVISTDPNFTQNIEGALDAGLKVGVYFFSEAITEEEAREEADYVLNLVADYKLSMPIVFDYEDFNDNRLGKANLTKAQHTQIAKAFCQQVKNAGYVPAVYASASFFKDYMDGMELSESNMIWSASYSKEPSYYNSVPYDFWQYTDKGDGYKYGMSSSTLDMDYWYTDDEEQLIPPYENYVANLESYSLSLGGKIGVNLYMNFSSITANDPGAYVQIKVEGHDPQKIMIKDNPTDCFTCQVASTEMTKPISVKVVRTDGRTSDTFTCTVKQYADELINIAKTSDAETSKAYEPAVKLVKSMLNYGGYAQEYFAYDEAPKANATLTEAERNVSNITAESLGAVDKNITGADTRIEYIGSSLILQGTTTVRHYFRLKPGTDINIDTIECKIDGEPVKAVAKTDKFYIEKTDILAHELSERQTAAIGGINISYSGLSYVKDVLSAADKDEKLKNLVRALYLYNKSAEEY